MPSAEGDGTPETIRVGTYPSKVSEDPLSTDRKVRVCGREHGAYNGGAYTSNLILFCLSLVDTETALLRVPERNLCMVLAR